MLFILLNLVAFIGVVIASSIILFKKTIRFPFKILAAWMVTSLIFLPYPILIQYNQFENFPNYIRVPAPFMYLIGPFLYFFTRTIYNDEKKFRSTDWLHFLPAILHLLELMPFYLGPIADKIELIKQVQGNNLSVITNSPEGFFNAKYHTVFKLLSILIYTIISIGLFYKNYQLNRSYKNKFNVSINIFVITLIVTRIAQLILTIVSTKSQDPEVAQILINLPFPISLILMVILLLINTINISGISDRQFDLIFPNYKELNIEEKQIKLQAMDNSSSNITFFISKNYEIIHFNKAAEEFIFLTSNKIISQGDSIKKIFKQSDYTFLIDGVEQVINDEKTSYVELELETSKNGNKEWFSTYFTPVYNDHSELLGVTSSTRNIHIRKESERKNQEYIAKLETIAFRDSHLLRAPLVNIIGLADQLAKTETSSADKINTAEFIKLIQSEARKLDKIIKENVKLASDK